MTLFGVNAADLSSDVWSVLLRWIGPQLYMRRMKLSIDIEGNGLELWRKLFAQCHGSDDLLQIAGRTKLDEFPGWAKIRDLERHVEHLLRVFY